MDNLTHSLVGLAAARAGLDRTSPLATAACVLAANLPDADIVALAGGPSFYLEHHRGITHSVVGTLALGLLLPFVMVAGERIWARLRGREPRARLKGLMLCSLLLVASHPLLDWTNSYGVRPLLPWDGSWFYGDLVFILDPYLWLALGGTVFLATARTKWQTAAWAAFAFVLSLALLLAPRRAGLNFPTIGYVIWFGGLGLVAAARSLGVNGPRARGLCAAALALTVAYWGGLSLFQRRAIVAARVAAEGLAAARGERVLRVAAMPVLADPTVWLCAAETDAATVRYELDLSETSSADWPQRIVRVEKPAGAERELVERAGRDERVAVLLDFARFPAARLGRNCAGEVVAQFSDLRFTAPGERGRGGSFSIEVPVSNSP